MKDRYWVYIHDKDGELVDDRGEFDSVQEAMDDIADLMQHESEFRCMSHTIRLVDHEAEGTTIWMAGSMRYIKSIAGTMIDA